jgi:ribose transport system ATP-binding protein
VNDAILQTVGLSKAFQGTLALNSVDFDLRRGECHVLFGENGAGKSTLIQILAGVHRPSHGTILHDGKPIELHSVHHSRTLGISAVFQEFSIAPALSVAENLFLGSEPRKGIFIDRARVRSEAKRILASLNFQLELDRAAGDLSRAEQQMLEIARAFRTPPAVLILDEPTASLTEAEADSLFNLVDRLKRQQVGVIYITHRMREIQRVGDRVTVLRDGRRIATLPMAEATDEHLISLMTGRAVSELFPQITWNPGPVLLAAKSLTTHDRKLVDVELEVRAGEVVGVAGLVGSGKGELGRACLGVTPLVSGAISVAGRTWTHTKPRKALDAGLCYVPSDRRQDGLFLDHSVRANISIASLTRAPIGTSAYFVPSREESMARDVANAMTVRPLSIQSRVASLSGGNQQKVMIGRFVATQARVYIFDEPTVGVDVGARHAIYERIKALCEAGAAVLLVSSDLAEITHLTHRAYVMHRGQVVGHLSHEQYRDDRLLTLMFGAGEGATASPTTQDPPCHIHLH